MFSDGRRFSYNAPELSYMIIFRGRFFVLAGGRYVEFFYPTMVPNNEVREIERINA